MGLSIKELMDIAKRTADKSDVKHKVSCILIDDNGNIVTTGYNHHSIRSKRLGRNTIHAECDALSKVRKPSSNLTMFLYRHNNNPIHPCPCCVELIKAYGIKEVISFHTIKIVSESDSD